MERATASYVNNSEKFLHKSKSYTQQYCHLYSKRLERLKGPLREVAGEKYSATFEFSEKIIDLVEVGLHSVLLSYSQS